MRVGFFFFLSLASAHVIPNISKRGATDDSELKKIGDYEIKKLLQKGASSSVYLGEANKKLFALKVCKFDRFQPLTIDKNPEAFFAENEVNALRQIPPHDNIIKLEGQFSAGDLTVNVLEYVEDGDLYTLVANHYEKLEANNFRLAKLIFKQILQAVYHLHSNNYAHLDLKEENILVCFNIDDVDKPTGKEVLIKLADFGFAAKADSPITMLKGTPAYLSPELVTSKFKDAKPKKVDSWALGIILHTLLTKKSPFYDADKTVVFHKVEHFPYLDFLIPDGAKNLVSKLLQKNLKDRVSVEDALNDEFLRV